jgi:hypothetical protein
MTDTGWIKEGARVAEVFGYGPNRGATLTTITRVTPTQIVTAHERRYNRDTLEERGGGNGRYRKVLHPLDTEIVRATVGRQELEHLPVRVDRLVRSLPGSTAEVHAVLDEIAAELARIRAAVDQPWSTVANGS